MSGFKKTDQELFLKIANDVKEYPNKYQQAGKWLDRYYDDAEFWVKKQKEIEQQKYRLMTEIKKLESEIKINTSTEDDSLFDNTVNKLEGELFTKKQRLEFLSQFETERKPPLRERLAYALEDLYGNYIVGGVLSQNKVKAALLITWVATDPEANETRPNLTMFANMIWETRHTVLDENRFGLAPFLFFELDIALHYQYRYKPELDRDFECSPIYELDLNYLRMIHRSWAKLEATKEYEKKAESKGVIKTVKEPLGAMADEDWKLFLEIGTDIKKHPDKYRNAGRWLDDEFYDIESFWQRKELHYRYLLDTIEHDVDEFASVLGDEYDEEVVFWSAMIEAKVFRPISTLRLICDNKIKEMLKKGEEVKSGIALSTEGEFTKVRFLDEGISKEIEDTLEDCKDLDNGVQKKYRLSDALNDLLRIRRFVSAENSRRILLVTWLITDPDAHKVGLNLTQFEDWFWSLLCEKRKTGLVILDWGRCEVFSLLSENKSAWMALLRQAWDKIKAEKDSESEKPAETERRPAPVEEQPKAEEKNKGGVKKTLKVIGAIIGFLAALLTCIYLIWWLCTKFSA